MSYIVQNKSIDDNIQTEGKILLWGVLLSGAFLFCFAKAIVALAEAWYNSYIYSYGFLVPLVSIYIVWGQRKRIKHIQLVPSYLPGLPVLLAGIVLLVIGTANGGTSIKGFSIITAITGIILLVSGRQFFKCVWFPIAYLLFMVPFWDNFTERLHWPLQIFCAMNGAMLLNLIGIPVYRASVYLSLPHITLEVAKECSGVNQLIAIVAMAVPLAYLSLGSWWKRILLIVSGIIIAVASNGLRVALIGVLSYYGISSVLHGPFHVLEAMSVSILGYIGLFIVLWILSRGEAHTEVSVQVDNAVASEINTPSGSYKELIYPFLLSIGILLFVGSYINFYQ